MKRSSEMRAVMFWIRPFAARYVLGLVTILIACGAPAEDVDEAAPVAKQAEMLLKEKKFLDALELVAGSDSAELVSLQFRAELEIAKQVDYGSTLPGSDTAHFWAYVRSHESDFKYSEGLSGFRLSSDRNEYFLRRLRELEAAEELVNPMKLEMLNVEFRVTAEGGLVSNKWKRAEMEAFKMRYEELSGAAGVDVEMITERIALIAEQVAIFDKQQDLQGEAK